MNIEKIISEMSIKDKVRICTGKDFWCTKDFEKYGIPSIKMADGPHGLRYQSDKGDNLGVNESMPSTCFSAGVTSCNSWNKELYGLVGKAIGLEALDHNVKIVLGPACNIKRNPLCGRNFEYLSEDPVLAGNMAASFIKGQQSTGIKSCLKHFALNNQEYKRFVSNSIVDERALHEIYLKPFEIAVKDAKPGTIMCSYNKINGTYSSDNKWLLTDMLRNNWGFDGLVITDWGALNDQIAAFKAGCDLNMPGGSDYMLDETIQAIKDGKLAIEDVDKSVRRILETIEEVNDLPEASVNYDANHQLAIEMAKEGAVLLKNDGILPLDNHKVLLLGDMAENVRYQGSGSSHINPTRLDSIKDKMVDATYLNVVDKHGKIIEEELNKAKELAKEYENIVIVAGLCDEYESEGFDRENMKMPLGHLRMIEEIASVNHNIVVVLLGGSVMEIPFEKDVKAILYMGLAGQGIGQAVYDLLYGNCCPSGKLSESWPMTYDDVISKDTYGKKDALYMESIYVGYRYYDKANVKLRYPFGYGLSYSEFEYSNLKINDNVVCFKLKNIGQYKAKEVVQLYVSNPQDGIYRPIKELKDFVKVELEPNEEKELSFNIDNSYFEVYDDGFKVYEGTYKIMIGSSSKDIRLSIDYQVEGLKNKVKKDNWYYSLAGKPNMNDFKDVMGKEIDLTRDNTKGNYTMNNSCMEMKDGSWIIKIQYMVTKNIVSKQCNGVKDMQDPTFKMMMISATDCPLRASVINSQGMMKNNMGEGLLEMANGHYIKGIQKMLKKGVKDD